MLDCFRAKIIRLPDLKTGALLSRPFEQVLASRILTVIGEVAEWPKAAVC
jgi:hypothetical protein